MAETRQTRSRVRFRKKHNLPKMSAEPELPSALSMARNTIRAASDLLVNGFESVDKKELKRREAICFECEHFRKSDNRCGKCGCFLQWKSKLRAWHCPVEKW